MKKASSHKKGISTGLLGGILIAVILVAVGAYFYENQNATKPPTTTTSTSSSVQPSLEYANIQTSLGTIELQLYPNAAPHTVANFINLSESGFYDDLVWHRIVPGFVIQTGDPNTRGGLNSTRPSWGMGGSNTTVPLEINGSLHNYVDYVGMARKADPSSGTSQFYINLANNTNLDGEYTVFGKVISGMNVVQAIANVPICQPSTCPSNWPADEPVKPVFIVSITIRSNP